MITTEQIEAMAKTFWMNHGVNPTHIIMTLEQQKELSVAWKPKERIVGPSSGGVDYGLTAIHLNPNVVLDILTFVPMRSGTNHDINYPMVVNLSEGKWRQR